MNTRRDFLVLGFFVAAWLLASVNRVRATDLLNENFDSLQVGQLTPTTAGDDHRGPDGWYLAGGVATFAQVTNDSAMAHSQPQFLQLRDGTGSHFANVVWVVPATGNNLITSSENNEVTLCLREDAVNQSGLYVDIYGNDGAVYISRLMFDFGGGKLNITNANGATTALYFKKSLTNAAWYKLDMHIKPKGDSGSQTVTYTVTDAASGYSLLQKDCPVSSGQVPARSVYGIRFQNSCLTPSNIDLDDVVITGKFNPQG